MNQKLPFASDYQEGAHPDILKALADINLTPHAGYGTDEISASAREKIFAACKAPKADVFFLAGGTQTNVVVISDEIYAELTYDGRHVSPANLPELYDRTIVVNGFSKAYAMTGWRMGYLCAPPAAIKQLVKLHQFGIMSAPTTSQYAAIEAMRNGDRDIEAMRADYDHRRRFLVHGLREAGLDCYEPRGAFYVFPSIQSTGLTSEEFCEKFLLAERVAAIPGTAFGPGGEGFVRMCYAASMEDLTEALRRLSRFLDTLK